jgi:hypothetical protein
VSKSTSAPHAHPSTEEHDDTVEAHYACLERPHACIRGVVYVGHLVEGDHVEDLGLFDAVPCRRCADNRRPRSGNGWLPAGTSGAGILALPGSGLLGWLEADPLTPVRSCESSYV